MSASARRGTIRTVPILLLLAAAVILVGVVSVAMGHGGEMAEFATDSLPPRLDDVMTAADVATLRPPSALWGYNVQATDEALSRIAQVISERDVEIAVLRQQLAELRSATGSHPAIAATLLARSKAASTRGSAARKASTPEAGTCEAAAGQAGSPGGAVPAAGPPDPPSPEQGTPGGDVPRNGAAGTLFPGSGAPRSGAPRSGEAAAGRDD